MALNTLAFKYLLAVVFLSITVVVTVILRCITRRLGKIPQGLDDYFIYGAVVFLIGMSANGTVMYMHGGADGTLFDDLSDASKEIFYKCFYATEILYYFCMLPTKLSLLALYHRVFSSATGQGFRIALWANVGICIAWLFANLLPTVLQCQPFARIWNKAVDGTCLSAKVLWPALNISNLLTDILILFLPLYWVAKLHMDIARRIVSAFMLILGASACGVSALRVYNTYNFTTDAASKDLICSFWTILEPAVAILTACLPSLRPLLPGWLGRRFSDREASDPEHCLVRNASGPRAQSSPIDNTFPPNIRNRRWSGATASAQSGSEAMPVHSRRCSYLSNFAGNNGTEFMPPLQESPFLSGLPNVDGTDTTGMTQDADRISPVEVQMTIPHWINVYYNAIISDDAAHENIEENSVQNV